MLPTLLGAVILLAATGVNAAKLTISVSNFSFSPDGSTPSTVTIALGDTVRWSWVSGNHTTTSSSATIPSGAATWNSNINSSTTFFEYKPTVAGTYNYVCTPHASMGMTGSFIVTGCTPPAKPAIASANGSSACAGNAINLSTPAQTGATYQWYNGTTALSTSNTLSATTAGSYTVKVSRCSMDSTSVPFMVMINTAPVPSFTQSHTGLTYTFTSTTPPPATGTNTYQWTFSDGSPVQTTSNATRTFAAPGTYTVTLKATTPDNCSASTQSTIQVALGVVTVAGGSYAVLPNPATSSLEVHTTIPATLSLIDFNGKLVAAPASISGIDQQIDVHALPAGIYLLRITTATGFAVEKISVMH